MDRELKWGCIAIGLTLAMVIWTFFHDAEAASKDKWEQCTPQHRLMMTVERQKTQYGWLVRPTHSTNVMVPDRKHEWKC